MTSVEQGHLGGYIEGGDEATYFPNLWSWIVVQGWKNILDIGCGDGVAVNYWNSIGANAWGVEGIWQPNERIVEHDYAKGTLSVLPGLAYDSDSAYDLIWCCEFVEHVEEAYVNNFLDSFAKGKIVLMTHGEPGQAGYHHVNLQPASYWIEKLRTIDYSLDIDLTMKTRELSAFNSSPWNHFTRSGMAFRRNDDPDR